MSLRDAARKVVQSLESRPGLFYEVLLIVRDEYEVAGPWEDSADGRESERRDTRGGTLAVVSYMAVNDRYDWGVSFSGGVGTVDEHGSCDSLDEAKVEADGVLRGCGYLLA